MPHASTSLTPREREVLELLRKGLTNREISGVLHVSAETVKSHTARVFRKLGVSNRTEAVSLYPSVEPAIQQLPPPPRVLVGRVAELAALDRAVQAGGRCLGLAGMGGVGKTALALVAALRWQSRFADGQIYIDLRGTTAPLSPLEAMRHVLRSLDPGRPHLDSVLQVESAYRSTLHDRSLVLLLDNAASAAQVEPLLPSPSCLLLVTSRRQLVLPGLHSHRVTPLDLEAAGALIASMAPQVAEAGREIAALCGGLPLALVLAGRTLAERPDLHPGEYVEQLSRARSRLAVLDEGEDGRGLDGSFALSYGQLEPSRQAQLCALSLLVQNFDRAAAAALWDIDIEAADRALGDLLRRSLLEWVGGRGSAARYRLHDLLRLFAMARLDPKLGTAVKQRHAEHYLTVLEAHQAHYAEGAQQRALLDFDRDSGHIRAAFEWARAQPAQDPVALRVRARLPSFELWTLRQHPRERAEWCEIALEAAGLLRDTALRCRLLGQLGLAHLHRGEVQAALEFTREQLDHARVLQDPRLVGNALLRRGMALRHSGQCDAAIALLDELLVLAREQHDIVLESRAVGNLAVCYMTIGEMQQAQRLFAERLELARKLGDLRGEGVVLVNLAIIAKNTGQLDRARELQVRHLEIAEELGDRRAELLALINLADIHVLLSGRVRASELYTRALELARAIGARSSEATALQGLASAMLAEGRTQRALELYADVLAIARGLGDRTREGYVLTDLGKLYRGLAQIDEAIDHLERAVDMFSVVKRRHAEAEARFELGRAFEQRGEYARAAELMQARLDYRRSIGHVDVERDAAELLALRDRIMPQELGATCTGLAQPVASCSVPTTAPSPPRAETERPAETSVIR
jgi:DNA-binding CsgD family transcriptional regulator/tetratricopeptide (TPR) repeat protein